MNTMEKLKKFHQEIVKIRVECLNAHWFLTLEDAREKLENWRRHYSEDRPRSAIGDNVPIALNNPDGVASPPLE